MKRISQYVTLVLALFGIVQIADYVYGLTRSYTVVLASSVALVCLIGLYEIVRYFYNPFVFRFFRVPPFSDCINIQGLQRIAIDQRGRAVCSTTRTYVFTKEPKPWNLFDTLFAGLGFRNKSIQDLYSSKDADIVSHKMISRNRIVIYWRPKHGSIIRHVPYMHEYTFASPADFSEDKNFWVFYKVFAEGTFDVEITTSRPVLSASVIRKPRFRRCFTESEVEACLLRTRTYELPQPIVVDSTVIRWKAENIGRHSPVILYWTHDSKKPEASDSVMPNQAL
jgi:hypothetical protein